MDHCIILVQHLSNHMHLITNGYKRFSKTNSTDPRQRVPLTITVLTHSSGAPFAAPHQIVYKKYVTSRYYNTPLARSVFWLAETRSRGMN